MATLEETVPPPPDVIFLDLNMPLKNGYEALIEIRNTPKLKGIPVVIFSTTSSECCGKLKHTNMVQITLSANPFRFRF